MPCTESHTIHSDPDDPHAYAATNAMLDDLTPAAIEVLLEVAGPGAGLGAVIDIRHLGGAIREPGHTDIAVDHRAAGDAQSRGGYRRETYTRPAALKAVYDPGNTFRFNRNIAPMP